MDAFAMMQIKRLTDECVQCAGALNGLIMGPPQNISKSTLHNYAIESFGFIIAFLYYSGGISLDEAGSCNACFIASTFGNNKELFYKTAKTIDFYIRIFLKFKDKHKDFIKYSIIQYNLKHPQVWNDFNNGFPLGELNFFDVTKDSVAIKNFLKNNLPKKINPILELL